MTDKKTIGTQLSRAQFDVTTINEEARTIDVIFATETPVIRSNWDGVYYEILDCNPGSVRMARLNKGAAVLDSHRTGALSSQIGVVELANITNKEGRATLRFSKRDDVQAIWADVKDGIHRGISVGYNVYRYDITEQVGEPIPTYRAMDWEPTEISFVTVPADHNSTTRNADNLHEVIIHDNKNQTMFDNQTAAGAAEPTTTAAPAATVVNVEEVTRAATIAANTRSSAILHAVRSAGFDIFFGETLVNDDKITIDGARAAIINKLAEKQATANTRSDNAGVIIPGADETDKRREGISNAIISRVNPALIKPAAAGEYRGMSLVDLARECLEASGTKTRGMTAREIAKESLGMGQARALSTSDFPIILGNTINRTLRTAYDLAPRTFLPWTRQSTAKDFKPMSRAALSDFSTLDFVEENGEYKMGSIGESAEVFKVAKYGKILPITWEAIINDDMDMFGRIPQAMAAAAAQKQSDLVYNILTGAHKMADGKNLFHADHGNFTATGTALSVDSLGLARAAIRTQTAAGGSVLNLIPKYLIVGPAQEQLALQMVSAAIVATKAADANVWAGTLTLIVEPRIKDKAWYLACEPSSVDTIEYAFLDGEELFTETKSGFEVDGIQTKVRMVFGAKAIEYRSLYKNNGA